MGQGKGEGSGTFVLLCILVLIVGIVAAVGMVISILNYTRESGTPISITVDGPEGTETGEVKLDSGRHYDRKIWTLQMDPSLNQKRLYIDAKSRQLRGYIVDVVHAVCLIAGKNCQMVDSSYSNCWTGGTGGAGILDKWFDVCVGLSVSLDRVRSFKFSVPFSPTTIPAFVTRAGNPGNFDPNNLAGKKIGFLSGWWADRNCLFYSTDYQITTDNIVTYQDIAAAITALQNDQVDSIFVSKSIKALDNPSISIIKDLPPCLLGGDSIMMRKDSLFKEWWDPAFETMIKSRTYRGICSDIDDPNVHGNIPGGTAANMCLN